VPENPQSALPKSVAAAFQALAGLAGASAVILAAASFSGWRYTRAYYSEIGIPFSELEFSTTDYAFLTARPMEFVFFVAAASFGGVSVGIHLKLSRRYQLAAFAAAALLLTALYLAVPRTGIGDFLDEILGGALGAIFVLLLGTAFVASVAGTWLFRALPAPDHQVARYVAAALLILVGSGMLLFMAEHLGTADARYHVSQNTRFRRATFIVDGTVGYGGERRLDAATGVTSDGPCPEFAKPSESDADGDDDDPDAEQSSAAGAQEAEPRILCEVDGLRLVEKNEGKYFVLSVVRGERTVYVIPQERVVRVLYERAR
jgi:hypothetical protein